MLTQASTILHFYPPELARSYQSILKPQNSPAARHRELLDLGKAMLAHVAQIVLSEYLVHRTNIHADPAIEKDLQELAGKPNLSLGDRMSVAFKCWQAVATESLLKEIPRGNDKGRKAVLTFLRSWQAIRSILADNPAPDVHYKLNFKAMVGKYIKGNKASSFAAFSQALVQLRNIDAHKGELDFSIKSDGVKIRPRLGDTFYGCVNPLLRGALEELLKVLEQPLTDYALHDVTTLKFLADGSRRAELTRHEGLVEAYAEACDDRLEAGTRWLCNARSEPVLQMISGVPKPIVLVGEPDSDQAENGTEQISSGVTRAFQLLPIDGVADEDTLGLPQRRNRPLVRHQAVRQAERDRLRANLKRDRSCWLVADWGLGKEEFLSCCLYGLFQEGASPETYTLRCDDTVDAQSLVDEFDAQFGVSLTRFCSAMPTERDSVLILDQIPATVGREAAAHNSELQRVLQPILDYCPKLHVILVARRWPGPAIDFVELKPLTVPELSDFISSHPDAEAELEKAHIVDFLYQRSGGQPMRVDALIRTLRVTSLTDLLDFDPQVAAETNLDGEPIPKSLVAAVGSLAQSEERYTQRSYRLLKVLTILSHGETLSTIKRFEPSKPFHPQNVTELEDLALLEAIPLMATPASVGVVPIVVGAAKLLRIPTQVRDYVLSTLDEKERTHILWRAADLLFGPKWREGKPRIRNANLLGAGSVVSPAGLGNEHKVCCALLRRALERNDESTIGRIATLGVGYCNKLQGATQYKEAAESAEELLHLLKDTDRAKERANLMNVLGNSLYMSDGREAEAIQVIQRALDTMSHIYSKSDRASMQLDLAKAHRYERQDQQALVAAKAVQELSGRDSASYASAALIILQIEMKGAELRDALTNLERIARRNGHQTAANNVALAIADDVGGKEALRHYGRVLESSKDGYTRLRALVSKAEHLAEENGLHELTKGERAFLRRGYSYLHSQSMISLFTRCHRVVWELLGGEADSALQRLRIFRHSSFVWRIWGKKNEEAEFLNLLDDMPAGGPTVGEEQITGYGNRVDLEYLWRRRTAAG